MKLILLNGAPRTGKDHSAHHLIDNSDRLLVFERFSRPIKEAFAAMMMVGIDEFFNVDGYEAEKDKIIPLLGVSFRQWQIDFSEKFMKPLYGKNIFGKLLLSRLEEYPKLYPSSDYGELIVVIPDCGFQIEVDTVVADFPGEDILLIRIERPGFDFTGDSREHVEPTGGMRFEKLDNHTTVDEFEEKLRAIYQSFVTT